MASRTIRNRTNSSCTSSSSARCASALSLMLDGAKSLDAISASAWPRLPFRVVGRTQPRTFVGDVHMRGNLNSTASARLTRTAETITSRTAPDFSDLRFEIVTTLASEWASPLLKMRINYEMRSRFVHRSLHDDRSQAVEPTFIYLDDPTFRNRRHLQRHRARSKNLCEMCL